MNEELLCQTHYQVGQLTNISNVESIMNNDSNHSSCPPGNLIVQSVQIWTLAVGVIRTQALQCDRIIVNPCIQFLFYFKSDLKK